MAWLNADSFWTLACVPLAVVLFLLAAWRRKSALRRFGETGLVRRLASTISRRRRRWKAGLKTVGLAFLAFALAGPLVGTKLREVKREGVDMVIALDVSMSMTAEDVAPNRLERAKNEIRKLLGDLRGDRIGLVIFAGDAFVQCPLTTDYGAVRLFLDVASPDLLPTPGTDFGEALRLAVQALEAPTEADEDARSRALLIVSDGENHVADLDAILEEARRHNVIVFAAGVGEPAGGPIPLYQNGRHVGYKRDLRGNIIHTRLEEAGLKALSEDGAYFQIARTSSSLPKIISALERLDRAEFGVEEFEEYDNKYQIPLLLALLLLLVEGVLPDRRKSAASA